TGAIGTGLSKVAQRYPSIAKAQMVTIDAARRAGQRVPTSATPAAGGWVRSAGGAAGGVISKVGRVGLTPGHVVAKHQEAGHPVESLSDIRKLDLRDADDLLGRGIDWYYPVVAAVSGAGSGLVITGGDLAIAVSGGAAAAPGAAVIGGTMALDASVVLSLAARAVGQVALAYGYDPEAPEEKVFALSVVNLGTSMSTGAKYTAMADVSRLTQALFRTASWEALKSSVVAQLYVQFGTRFGVRVTKQGLGKVVPVIGIALGAAFNWATLEAMVDSARLAYRRRFLLEKYPHLEENETSFGGGSDSEDDEVISVLDELVDVGGPDLRGDGDDAEAGESATPD
ncbi:MAG: EcsC family protein, partial [Rhodoglobus sp.]